MHLRIPFSEIPEHGVQYEYTGTAWFPDELQEGAESVSAQVQLTRKQDDKIEMKGMLAAQVMLNCDRCLGRFGFAINSPFNYIIELAGTPGNWHVHDIESGSGDFDTIEVDEPVVDIGDLLRQQVILSLPDKILCRTSCRGLCSHCGADMNEEKCGCAAKKSQSPFAVLQTLKTKVKD